jgi:hypothetical protein
MFNRDVTVHAPVHIEQQPNDAADAARLHGELRANAEKEVANALVERFGAFNEFTVVRIEPTRNFCNDELRVRLLFKVNGHLYDFWVDDLVHIEEQAMTVVAQHLVSQILNKLFRNPMRSLPTAGA